MKQTYMHAICIYVHILVHAIMEVKQSRLITIRRGIRGSRSADTQSRAKERGREREKIELILFRATSTHALPIISIQTKVRMMLHG